MTYKGILKGNTIVLDETPPIEDGTAVDVDIAPHEAVESPPGSPQAVLKMVGWLTREEADHFNQVSAEMRRVDPKMWK